MELVDAGVDLIYIRDLLGHVSVKVTERYAREDAANKRRAIEAASKEIVPPEKAQWEANKGLREWLKGLNRRK
jgi:integrase